MVLAVDFICSYLRYLVARAGRFFEAIWFYKYVGQRFWVHFECKCNGFMVCDTPIFTDGHIGFCRISLVATQSASQFSKTIYGVICPCFGSNFTRHHSYSFCGSGVDTGIACAIRQCIAHVFVSFIFIG